MQRISPRDAASSLFLIIESRRLPVDFSSKSQNNFQSPDEARRDMERLFIPFCAENGRAQPHPHSLTDEFVVQFLCEDKVKTTASVVKEHKRALRRFHNRRMLERAIRVIGHRWATRDDASAKEWARRNYDHITKCSCFLCSSRRHWNGPPIQERKLLEVPPFLYEC